MTITEWEAVLALPVEPARDHIRGPRDAAVMLVEYGDYECPYCGAAYPIVKDVQAAMRDERRFVFRNFPITTVHPHAAQAAEARRRQLRRNFSGRCTTFCMRTSSGLDGENLIAYANG